MENKWLGEDIKFKISIKPIDGMTLDDFDWEIELWCNTNNKKVIEKTGTISIGNGAYFLCLDSNDFGIGILKLKLFSKIPDRDFEKGYRKQLAFCNLVNIIKLPNV